MASRSAMRAAIQLCISLATYATLPVPRRTLLGNCPAASKRAVCANEYVTRAFTSRFDSSRSIAELPVRERRDARLSPDQQPYQCGFDLQKRVSFLTQIAVLVVDVVEHLGRVVHE